MSPQNRRKVVVPIDFSDSTRTIVKRALEQATDPADIHYLHVLAPLSTVSPAVIWGDMNDDKRTQAIHDYFQKHYADLEITPDQLTVRVGDPGFETASFAKEQNADLIVIASHGNNGIARLLLGSVTERVIREANCDVLVVRTGNGNGE